jgi:hypothetical protein
MMPKSSREFDPDQTNKLRRWDSFSVSGGPQRFSASAHRALGPEARGGGRLESGHDPIADEALAGR